MRPVIRKTLRLRNKLSTHLLPLFNRKLLKPLKLLAQVILLLRLELPHAPEIFLNPHLLSWLKTLDALKILFELLEFLLVH
ncbi:MAG: hypothetical protein A2W80_08820 [Candidatus Riflebacteria bacterium GWC2_50_8]|nr:MAG: hypothetical protein A2W80_08820 [Candidatus Riflebacteria bacterium GWC2_50_8]